MEERTENSENAAGKPNKKDDAEAGSKGGNKILLIGIIAAIVIVQGIIALTLINATRPKDPDKEAAKAEADSAKNAVETTTHMGATTAEEPLDVVVNIAGTNNERFIKAVVIFEFDELAHPKLLEELERRTPKFKNIFIDVLSRMTLAELSEPDAKEKIRKDLIRRFNATLPEDEGQIREVLFTSYIIQ
jgi:flagellar protein FliL